MAHGETISINSFGKDTYLGVAFINPRGNFDAGIPSSLDRANARLIAAAPDLLEALQEWQAHKFTRPISDHPEAVEQRRIYDLMTAAIAKANVVRARVIFMGFLLGMG